MRWHCVAAKGSTRHLWVDVTGDGAPRYGRWVTPAGNDVDHVLGREGPEALDVPVWWAQSRGHDGHQLTDLLWQPAMLGMKLMSHRMLELLQSHHARLRVYEDIDIRLHSGARVPGYVGVHEETEQPGPVHSLWRGRRSDRLVVVDPIKQALASTCTGLSFEEVTGPFPADDPAFFAED